MQDSQKRSSWEWQVLDEKYGEINEVWQYCCECTNGIATTKVHAGEKQRADLN
jgi:hypothetical protein